MYNHQEIEKKWQKRWTEQSVGVVTETGNTHDALYYLIMFPYPSGAGLHVGHVESYTAIDILARMERMRGKNVLCPIGYDAFGLPAENYAIKTNVHPAVTTQKAIETFRAQMQSIGLSFDWSRELSTADPLYYKWTQWLFLLFYKHGLAYRKKSPVNWCKGCNTVLANEQVVAGACERCGTIVVQKDLEQWFFAITKYADRLLAGLDRIDWPEKIKSMQRNWIGKSVGAEVIFKVNSEQGTGVRGLGQEDIAVFTTRPDTLPGATFLVISPELAQKWLDVGWNAPEEVKQYVAESVKKRELERLEEGKEKTGVPTGVFAMNPYTQEKIPVWVADYVLGSYGTGAIMAVPAHDKRDQEFAEKFGLPIRAVVEGEFEDAKQKMIAWLEEKHIGRAKTTYRLRDWLVSRQRYWGAPIPIIWCEDCGAQPVEESALPVELPTDVVFSAIGAMPAGRQGSASGGKPTGESPLVDSKTFHDVTCPKCGKDARRESDTMDTFVDSSWYYLRYTDPHNTNAFADKSKIDYWCPVDLYLGGAEHAVMHLLYARFFAYALHDLGYLDFSAKGGSLPAGRHGASGGEEPFLKLKNQGLILGPDGNKMSKSKGNVVNPDDVVREYGADAIRLYEMFMGPLEDSKPWDTKGVVGARRFLDKVYNLFAKVTNSPSTGSGNILSPELVEGSKRTLHKAIKKVTEDLEALKFNTAISQLMIVVNEFSAAPSIDREMFQTFLKLLAPLAPHLAEELWEKLGHTTSIFTESWPTYDPSMIVDEMIELGVQINGKLRGTIQLSPDADEATAKELALANENVKKWLEGKEVFKVIYVSGRILSIVVKK